MSMTTLLLGRYAFQLKYLHGLVADVPDEKFADQPAPGVNHPAWIVGHLAWASEGLIGLLGGEKGLTDPIWSERYSAWTRALPDRSLYQDKATLLAALESAHTRAIAVVPAATPELLTAELPMAQFRSFLPTVGDAFAHILTTHEAGHIGQLSAWRRMMGFPPYAGLSFV